MDTTSTQVPVQHPLDAEAEDMPPAPVLVVATSDGKLRFYTVGHLTRPMEGVVRPPAPLPAVPSVKANAATSEAAEQPSAQSDDDWVRVEQAATGTALPANDDDTDLEEEDTSQPATALGSAAPPADDQLRQAAAAVLPSSSDEDEETRSSSDGGYDATPRVAAERMLMPPSQPAAGQRVGDEPVMSTRPPLGTAHRLSPAGAAAAARHAAITQPAGGGGSGFSFSGAFSFAASTGQSTSAAAAPFGIPATTSGAQAADPRPSLFGMPAFGQSSPVRPLFAAPLSTLKPPAPSPVPTAGKKVCSARKPSLHTAKS